MRRLRWALTAVPFTALALVLPGPGTTAGATFTVTTTADSGAGSLRQAIVDANASPAATIEFAIVGTAPFVITPATSLPAVTSHVTIDATSQAGFKTSPVVRLDGTTAGGTGIALNDTHAAVRGLSVTNWSTGIAVGAIDCVVQQNWIGLAPDGSVAGNSTAGVSSTADRTVVGDPAGKLGNVIGGNGAGVSLNGANQARVSANWIGVTPAGALVPNTGDGVDVVASSAVIVGNVGGTKGGNVIGASTGWGVFVGGASNDVRVLGNLVGITSAGTAAPNQTGGVDVVSPAGVRIGGFNKGDANVISGNAGYGLRLASSGTVVAQLNAIGTDAKRTLAVPNAAGGVQVVTGAPVVGGVGGGNLISGNGGPGIAVTGANTAVILGNTVGLNAKGAALPNSVGVQLDAPAKIGSVFFETGNVIAGNMGAGVDIGAGGDGAQLEKNVIGVSAKGVLRPNAIGVAVRAGATNVKIGEALAGAGNTISGNGLDVLVEDAATGVKLYGNTIGLDPKGGKAVNPATGGVELLGAGATVGGPNVLYTNVIAGTAAGLLVEGDSSTVQGNLVGVTAKGKLIPNGNAGIAIDATGAVVGGTSAGQGNTIGGNLGAGVLVAGGTHNRISGNAIFANGGLGISIGANNDGQAAPTVSSASGTSASLALTSAASTAFSVEVFASKACDAGGAGEGAQYLGTATLNTSGGGSGTTTATLGRALKPGEVVTATATNPGGSTSGFSTCTVAGP